jgi:hypothetical protein
MNLVLMFGEKFVLSRALPAPNAPTILFCAKLYWPLLAKIR